MTISNGERKRAFEAQIRCEISSLETRGVCMTGNGYSPILVVKGQLNEAEKNGGKLLAGTDGKAMQAALLAVGWEPEDFCGLSALMGESNVKDALNVGEPLSAALFREAVETLDPEAIVLMDDIAAWVMRDAYADELANIEDFGAAMLSPGLVASVAGRRVLALGGFEAALSDEMSKQLVWAYLKQLSPLGAPY